MDVSVVIRTKNEAHCIEDTLNRILEQDFTGKYEIIIVDSGSTDGTVDIVKRYNAELVEISQKEFTYGRSLNIGARSAKGRFIANLSAHAVPINEEWLTNLIMGFESDDVAGVYGRQLSIGEINPFDARQNEIFFGPKKIVFNAKDVKTLKKIHFSNSNCAIRKGVWERFKFNEEALYAEDTLWQSDVINAGFSIVYVPGAAVYHTHRISIYNAYKCSKDCSYTLAVMNQKRKAVPMIVYDAAVFLNGIFNSLVQNVMYIWRKNYLLHLKTAPVYVTSRWLGWFAGRIRYRFDK